MTHTIPPPAFVVRTRRYRNLRSADCTQLYVRCPYGCRRPHLHGGGCDDGSDSNGGQGFRQPHCPDSGLRPNYYVVHPETLGMSIHDPDETLVRAYVQFYRNKFGDGA